MNRICIIIAAICWGIGAVAGLLKLDTPINWTDAGLCFVAVAYIVGEK